MHGHPSWVLAGKDVDNRTQIERHVVLSMQGRGDFCIKRLKISRVTHGEDLCKNTPRVTHGEVLCKADLHNLPRKCVHTRYNYHGEVLCY